MKDTHTGTVCNCYVSFHEPSNRIITMPVDAIKIPGLYLRKRLDDKRKQKSSPRADSFPSTTYSVKKRHAAFRRRFRRSENNGHRIQAIRGTTEGQRHYHGCQNHTGTEKRCSRTMKWCSSRICATKAGCFPMMYVSATRATNC